MTVVIWRWKHFWERWFRWFRQCCWRNNRHFVGGRNKCTLWGHACAFFSRCLSRLASNVVKVQQLSSDFLNTDTIKYHHIKSRSMLRFGTLCYIMTHYDITMFYFLAGWWQTVNRRSRLGMRSSHPRRVTGSRRNSEWMQHAQNNVAHMGWYSRLPVRGRDCIMYLLVA